MAWFNFAQSEELTMAAYTLAEEIRDGKWKHVFDPKKQAVPNTPELVDELRRRCPGYTVEAYKRALSDGMLASR